MQRKTLPFIQHDTIADGVKKSEIKYSHNVNRVP